MSDNPEQSLTASTRYKVWGLLLVLIVLHLTVYLPEFHVPHADLLMVMHVINNIWNPAFYGGDWFTRYLTNFHTQVAPVYYYGLAYPLRYLLSAKGTILSIGFLITLVSTYFAGRPWRRWKHALVASFVLLAILSVNVSPLEGNKRSFTAFFILVALGMDRRPKYLGFLFLTALAAGVYAPAGLILLVYYGIGTLDGLRQNPESLRTDLLKNTGLLAGFLAGLTPYWLKFLSGGGTDFVRSFVDTSLYSFSSLEGLVRTFILGSRGSHYGALFMKQEHLDLFLIVGLLCLVQYCFLRREFEFRRTSLYMILASITLWCLAHLMRPYLYFPFKYTRLTLAVPLAIPAAENIPVSVRRLRECLRSRSVLRFLVYLLGLGSLGFFGLYTIGEASIDGLNSLYLLGPLFWKFLIVLPFVVSLAVLVPGDSINTGGRNFILVLLLSAMIFFPPEATPYKYMKLSVSTFDGLYEKIRQSPPGSRVAGPPTMMHTIPVFGLRATYNTPDWRVNDVMCRRNRKYWSAVFASSPADIRAFMKAHDIDFMIVDRYWVKRRDYFDTMGCIQKLLGTIDTEDPYLEQPLAEPVWQKGERFVVITPETLAAERQEKRE